MTNSNINNLTKNLIQKGFSYRGAPILAQYIIDNNQNSNCHNIWRSWNEYPDISTFLFEYFGIPGRETNIPNLLQWINENFQFIQYDDGILINWNSQNY